MKRTVSALLCVWLCSVVGLLGQAVTSLTGTVDDPSGAAVTGAVVTLTNVLTGAQRTEKTDAAGRYSFQEVQPGTYSVSASALGFAETVVKNVELRVNSPATVRIGFEKIGAVTEAVSVSAQTTQVNTTDASLGNAIDTRPIMELPFEARNVVGLLSVQPGVSYTGSTGEGGDFRSGAVNGGKSDQGNVTLDGVDVNDQQERSAFTSVLRVTLDSVEEFRTTTTNGGSDMGRTSGAQVSLITKSGTNNIHGALYEYNRNTYFTANGFFNNLSGVGRPALSRNVYGAAIGGPIRRNHLFYFLNFEGRREASESTSLRTIPNALFRQGVFSYEQTDGTTGQLTADQVRTLADPAHIGPSTAILQLFQQYPMPNNNSVGDGYNTAGYLFPAPTPALYNTYIAKIDYQPGSSGRHQLFWRGNLQNDHVVTSTPEFLGQGGATTSLNNSKGMAFGYTWVATPNLVGNLRYGFTLEREVSSGAQTTPLVSLREVDNLLPGTKAISFRDPVHDIADDYSWTHGSHVLSWGGVMRFIRVQRLDFGSSFSSAQADGFWFADQGLSLLIPGLNPNDQAEYITKMTDLLGVVTQGSAQYNYNIQGQALPEGTGIARTYADNEYELYLSDVWKITRAMTVSAGVRASLFPPLYETHGIQTSSDVSFEKWFHDRGDLANAGQPQSLVQPISFRLVHSPGGHGLFAFQRHFSPRFSVTYSPQSPSGWQRWLFGGPGQSSIRAGFGLFYDLFGQGLIQLANSSAIGFSTGITSPANASELTTTRFLGPTTLPADVILPAPPSGFPQVAPDVFAYTNSIDNYITAPYTMNTTLSVGREFSHGFFVQGSFVERLSRKSLQGDDIANPTNLRDATSGQTYFEAATEMSQLARANTPVSQVPAIPFFEDIFPGYAGGGMTASQNLYTTQFAPNVGNETLALYNIDTGPGQGGCSPCSIFGPYALYNAQYSSLPLTRNSGGGYYNAMQWTVRKSWGSGVQFDLNYTYSESVDIGSQVESVSAGDEVINPWMPWQTRGPSDYDTRHLVSAFWVAELPFGHGRKFLGNTNRWTDAFLGGWQVSGIWRQSSGLPVSINDGGVWSTNWEQNAWATKIGPVQTHTTKNIASGLGPNMFSNPVAAYNAFEYNFPGTSGNRNILRGDGYFDIDGGVAKRFKMPYNENQSVQIRVEAFNVTNTTRFDVNSTYSSTQLGQQGSFGNYTGTLSAPREMQFSARYEF